MVRIPLSAIPNQEFNIVLAGQNCTINIYQRDVYMYLDLYVASEVVQRGALVCPLTSIITVSNNLFKGALYIVDNDKPSLEQQMPEYSGLGSRYQLYYLTESELKEYGHK